MEPVQVPSPGKGGGFRGGFAALPGKQITATDTTQNNYNYTVEAGPRTTWDDAGETISARSSSYVYIKPTKPHVEHKLGFPVKISSQIYLSTGNPRLSDDIDI